nr:hypothetical protein [Candidatus Anoxychlamydiales bacterium]
MFSIAKLFGRSPFAPLQSHMEKVSDCTLLLDPLFMALKEKNYEKIIVIKKSNTKKEQIAKL